MKKNYLYANWVHAILHAESLIQIIPTVHNKYFPLQLIVFGQLPNIFHFHIFCCAIYVLIAPLKCTKMGPQRRLRIYISFNSSVIIKYNF